MQSTLLNPPASLDTQASRLTVSVARSLQAVQSLAQEWDDLYTRCHADCLFLHPSWHLAWWKAFGEGKEMELLAIRTPEQRLVGIAPLLRYTDTWRGAPLRVVGTYNNDHASRADFLIDPTTTSAAVGAIVAHLYATRWRWDALFLRQVPQLAPWLEPLTKACKRRSLSVCAPQPGIGKCVIALQGTWAEFLAAKTSHFRARLKENMRRVQKGGNVVYRRSTGTSEDFAIFENLEAASWKSEDAYAKLGPIGWQFQREVALAEGNRCYNLFLELDGKVVGGIHAVGRGGRMYSMQMLFDESVRHLYPGRAQFATQISDMFDTDGVDVLDLNGNSPFCQSWTADTLEFVNLQIFSSNPYAQLLFRLKSWLGKKP